MLTYLASYLRKPEHKGKTFSIGNTFLTKREVFTHQALRKSIIFIYVVFKYRCPVCSYRPKKEKN